MERFEYEHFQKFILNMTREMFDHFKYLAPVAHVLVTKHPETGEPMDKPGITTLLSTGFSNEQEKDNWAESIRVFCKKYDAIAIAIVNEAWAVEQQKDEKYIQPSKHPNRIEIVSVVFETSRFGSTMCCANITRNGDDVRLEEFSKPLQSNIGGRFSGFLRAD